MLECKIYQTLYKFLYINVLVYLFLRIIIRKVTIVTKYHMIENTIFSVV